jgi:P27 family predicted phage terminase small subunit
MAPRRNPRSPLRGKRLRTAAASSALLGAPKCPEILDDIGKAKWAQIVEWLTALDLITKADGDTMCLYCAAYSRWYGAEAIFKQSGPLLKNKHDVVYRNPCLDVVNQASKEMQKLSRALGLDPLSRKRLGIRIAKPREVSKPDPRKEILVPNPRPTTAADVRDRLQEQVDIVRADPELSNLEKGHCIAALCRVALKAIEDGDTAARLDALEAILKTRKDEEAKS